MAISRHKLESLLSKIDNEDFEVSKKWIAKTLLINTLLVLTVLLILGLFRYIYFIYDPTSASFDVSGYCVSHRYIYFVLDTIYIGLRAIMYNGLAGVLLLLLFVFAIVIGYRGVYIFFRIFKLVEKKGVKKFWGIEFFEIDKSPFGKTPEDLERETNIIRSLYGQIPIVPETNREEMDEER